MSELNIPVIDFEDEVLAEVWAYGVEGLDDEETIETLNAQVAEIAEFDGELSAAKTIEDLFGVSNNHWLYVGALDDAEIANTFRDLKQDVAAAFLRGYGMEL